MGKAKTVLFLVVIGMGLAAATLSHAQDLHTAEYGSSARWAALWLEGQTRQSDGSNLGCTAVAELSGFGYPFGGQHWECYVDGSTDVSVKLDTLNVGNAEGFIENQVCLETRYASENFSTAYDTSVYCVAGVGCKLQPWTNECASGG